MPKPPTYFDYAKSRYTNWLAFQKCAEYTICNDQRDDHIVQLGSGDHSFNHLISTTTIDMRYTNYVKIMCIFIMVRRVKPRCQNNIPAINVVHRGSLTMTEQRSCLVYMIWVIISTVFETQFRVKEYKYRSVSLAIDSHKQKTMGFGQFLNRLNLL